MTDCGSVKTEVLIEHICEVIDCAVVFVLILGVHGHF